MVGFSWCSYVVKLSSPLESFSWRWARRLWFLAVFPSLFYRLLIFPFILARVHCPSTTCRVKSSKFDTCPISPYPKSLGVIVKVKEFGSVRCRALNGRMAVRAAFPGYFRFSLKLIPIPFLPLSSVGF